MFSSTTIASSMTMPTISVSASIVIWLSVKSSAAISEKAPMIDAGIATAAISVERKLRRNSRTMMAARMPPSTRCSSMACSDARMNSESSRISRTSKVGGSVALISAIRARMASASATVLTPLCFRMAIETAGLPFSIETDVGVAPVSSTVPMSRIRIGELPRVATTRSSKSSGRVNRPTVRTDSSRSPCSSRPPGSSRFCARSAVATSVVESA